MLAGPVFAAESTRPLIHTLLRDEGLTRSLGDVEARMLIEWAVGWAELLASTAPDAATARQLVNRVHRRAGAIATFVRLWGRPRSRAAACQLAAVERLTCPLPTGSLDPADLMQHILTWEPATETNSGAARCGGFGTPNLL